jgi:transcriptional regulator GlxA family with amidase domain
MTGHLTPVRIGILVFPDCVGSSAVVPFDVFNIANTVARYRPAAEHIRFEAQWVSVDGASVVTRTGLTFPTARLDAGAYAALLVPGLDMDKPSQMPAVLDSMAREQAALRAYHAAGGLIAANCSSTFLLAEAGLLEGKRATTSWWLNKHFRARYPNVGLDIEELLVMDGGLLTSGGVTAYIDQALWLVGHFASDGLRQMTAKVLVADSHRASQAPYIEAAVVEDEGHAVILRARRWLNQHMDQEWNMAQLAAYANTSPRTLLRRFQKALGMSPIQYTQQLRVERAKALLESTRLSLEDITVRCGYANVSTFSTVFKRWAEVTPREYRSRFGLRA